MEEFSPPQRIDVKLANSLDVAQAHKYQELKNGFSVLRDDGTGEVHPDQVLVGSPFKARKLALMGDTCGIPLPMSQLCKNADVLVHEATLDEKDKPVSIDFLVLLATHDSPVGSLIFVFLSKFFHS